MFDSKKHKLIMVDLNTEFLGNSECGKCLFLWDIIQHQEELNDYIPFTSQCNLQLGFVCFFSYQLFHR